MSLTKKTATYASSAIIVAIVVILAANIYVGSGVSLSSTGDQTTSSSAVLSSSLTSTSTPTSSQQTTSSAGASPSNSLVLVQLTDPPTVPVGTTSLNLTYTSIALVVAEPAGNGKVNTTTVTVTPTGGSATVDLLTLQNISETIASAALPAGSTIFSATLTVSGITIDVNGTSNPVVLATGGNTFVITLAKGTVLSGTNAVLLDLTPTVVDTPAGYQMIPTSVGIMRPQSEIGPGSQNQGSMGQLSDNDERNLTSAHGQLTASLVSLSASGNQTTLSVQVVNTGNVSVSLAQVGLQGNLTVLSNGCTATSSTSNSSTTSSTATATRGDNSTHGSRDQRGGGNGDNFGNPGCWNPGQWGRNELLFTPVSPLSTSTASTASTSSSSASSSTSTSTSSTACTSAQMALSEGHDSQTGRSDFVIAPGQCVVLTFTGSITFGETNLTLVPSTAAGQVYYLSVAASNDSQVSLSCTLPLSPTSCTTVSARQGW